MQTPKQCMVLGGHKSHETHQPCILHLEASWPASHVAQCNTSAPSIRNESCHQQYDVTLLHDVTYQQDCWSANSKTWTV